MRTLDPSWASMQMSANCLDNRVERWSEALSAKNIFLATPLLRWYLEHGLVVDKIYEVVEYVPEQ